MKKFTMFHPQHTAILTEFDMRLFTHPTFGSDILGFRVGDSL